MTCLYLVTLVASILVSHLFYKVWAYYKKTTRVIPVTSVICLSTIAGNRLEISIQGKSLSEYKVSRTQGETYLAKYWCLVRMSRLKHCFKMLPRALFVNHGGKLYRQTLLENLWMHLLTSSWIHYCIPPVNSGENTDLLLENR